MVEGRLQADRFRQEHAVSEHIARHVAAADHIDRLALHIDAHFEEMPLDRNPRTLGGDAHRLVVVSVGATAGEGIIEPEILRLRDTVRYIGEARRALVGSDHEIWVFAVADHHTFGVDDTFSCEVIGNRQQRADENFVACLAFRRPAITVDRRVGQLLGIEATLRAGRHDDCVLDPLGFHQPENFGAKVVAPVGPAQATARNRAGAQVDTLDPARIDEDFTPWHGLGQVGHEIGLDLERKRFLRGRRKGIRPQDRFDQSMVEPQQPVVIDRGNLGETRFDPVACCLCRHIPIIGEIRIVKRAEQFDERTGDAGCPTQGVDHSIDGKAHACLAQVAIEGAQPVGFGGRQASAEHQPVEGVVFGLLIEDRCDGFFNDRCAFEQRCRIVACRQFEREIVDRTQSPLIERGRNLLHYRETEILQRRDGIGQRQCTFVLVDLEPQAVCRIAFVTEQPGIALEQCAVVAIRIECHQMAHAPDIAGCLGRTIAGAIGGGEGIGETSGNRGGAPGLFRLRQLVLDLFGPAAQH